MAFCAQSLAAPETKRNATAFRYIFLLGLQIKR
jgi:hypothetical protein